MKTIEEILLGFFDHKRVDQVLSAEFADEGDSVQSAWYIKVLLGASGWFASLSLLGAFFALFTDARFSGIVIGLILCAGAWALNNFFPKKVFAQQFALALCLAGQAAATLFFHETYDSLIAACVFSIILSTVVAAVYRYSVVRFFAVQAAVIALMLIMEHLEWRNGPAYIIILLAIAVYFLWKYEPDFASGPAAALARSCAYAMAFSLLVVPVMSTHNFLDHEPALWLPATAAVAVLLVITAVNIFSSLGKPLASPAFAACALLTAAFAAMTCNSPGIITALFVTALGFRRGNRILTALAGLCLGGYLVMFYYNLSMTLLVKSYILMGSGALLIATWAVLARIKGGEKQ
jgi:hypothetical protein